MLSLTGEVVQGLACSRELMGSSELHQGRLGGTIDFNTAALALIMTQQWNLANLLDVCVCTCNPLWPCRVPLPFFFSSPCSFLKLLCSWPSMNAALSACVCVC